MELHYLVLVDLAVTNNKTLNSHSCNPNQHKGLSVHSRQIPNNKHKLLGFSEMQQVSQAKDFLENQLLVHNRNKINKQGYLEANNNNNSHSNKVVEAYLALHNKILHLEDNSSQSVEEEDCSEVNQLVELCLELHNKLKELLEHNLNNKLVEDYLGLKGKLNNSKEDGLINKLPNNHNKQQLDGEHLDNNKANKHPRQMLLAFLEQRVNNHNKIHFNAKYWIRIYVREKKLALDQTK